MTLTDQEKAEIIDAYIAEQEAADKHIERNLYRNQIVEQMKDLDKTARNTKADQLKSFLTLPQKP